MEEHFQEPFPNCHLGSRMKLDQKQCERLQGKWNRNCNRKKHSFCDKLNPDLNREEFNITPGGLGRPWPWLYSDDKVSLLKHRQQNQRDLYYLQLTDMLGFYMKLTDYLSLWLVCVQCTEYTHIWSQSTGCPPKQRGIQVSRLVQRF